MNHEPRWPNDDVPEVEPNCCAQRLEEAFARWQGELIGTLYFLVGNLEDARDVLQESFVKAWRQRHKVDEVQNLKAWLFRIAMNTGRDLRQSAWRRKKQSLPAEEGEFRARCETPPEILCTQEEQALLRKAIANLRPEEQEVFLLRQNGELTYEEIAAALEIPVGTVKTRMRLAVSKLKAAVAEV